MANSSGGWTPRDIKPGGWLIILIVFGSIGWFGVVPHLGDLKSLPYVGSIGNLLPKASSPTSGSGDSVAQGSDIVVLTTGTKKKWLSEEIDKFNAQSTSGRAVLDIQESREGMQHILAGAEQPDIWSPSSTTWSDRLAEIGPEKGIHIHQDNDDYRTLFQSPLVFLVAKNQLEQLAPILTSRHPFTSLARLNKFRFAYASPLNASSGMLTMTIMLNEYADIHDAADLDTVANSAGFALWLKNVDRGLVTENTEGSSQLEADFESNPGSRAFITTYESNAIPAVINNPDLAIVYPNPTSQATQVAVLVDGPWSTDARKATAKAFLDFITSDAASSDAVDLYFRPAMNGGAMLGQKVQSSAAATYFESSFRTVDLPSYDAINDANVVWNSQEH